MSYGKTMEAIIKDKELKAYEKGVRDMFDVMQISCEERYKATCCKLVSVKFNDECTFENCPIAQKLLKGVK